MNSCSASEKDVRLTCFAFKIVVLRIKNPPFSQQKIWRQNGGKNLVSRFSNAEKTEFLIKKTSSNSEESEELVREAGLEPARPEWTLEPESSESANSTTRASAVFRLLGYITTDIPACQAGSAEKVADQIPLGKRRASGSPVFSVLPEKTGEKRDAERGWCGRSGAGQSSVTDGQVRTYS